MFETGGSRLQRSVMMRGGITSGNPRRRLFRLLMAGLESENMLAALRGTRSTV
jgi:hypothetical protein